MKNLDLVILAGGRGKRLNFITKNKPKPLIKFEKIPFLGHLINYYAKYNFNKIFIIAGYKGNQIKKLFNNKKINLTNIECIIEKKPLGTASAIKVLKKKNIKNFVLANGDSFFDIDLDKFIKNTRNKLIKVALVKNENYLSNKKLNSLSLNKNKKIIFNQKSFFMNAGIYYFNKKIVNLINNEKSLENEIINKYINKKIAVGEIYNKFFIDIGTKKNLFNAKKKLKPFLKRPSVFLDRDGVINVDFGYVHEKENFKLKKGVLKGLQFLTKNKINIFIITNQSGIARGYYTEKQFLIFQKNINDFFIKNKILINDIAYCPHHILGNVLKYKKKCDCRKPNNQLIKTIFKNFSLDKNKTVMIGDQLSDEICAKKTNIPFFYSTENFFSLIKKIYKKKLK